MNVASRVREILSWPESKWGDLFAFNYKNQTFRWCPWVLEVAHDKRVQEWVCKVEQIEKPKLLTKMQEDKERRKRLGIKPLTRSEKKKLKKKMLSALAWHTR
jgi:hypothetical protein